MSDISHFDVYVIDNDGDPISGERVQIHSYGHFFGLTGQSSGLTEESTDDSGHAAFEIEGLSRRTAYIEIWVDGECFGPYYNVDGGAFTINLGNDIDDEEDSDDDYPDHLEDQDEDEDEDESGDY